MAMEMNRGWKPSDYKALAKRISFATGDMNGTYEILTEKGETPTAEQIQQYRSVAKVCKVFLAAYEKHN